MKKTLLIAFLAALLLASFAAAQQSQPSGSGIEPQLKVLQKVQDYNRQLAESTLRNVSFLIAFLGGILSFLAPCTVALLPAFLAYTTKSGRNITLATATFFSGFALSFMALGIALTALGKISFSTFQHDTSVLVIASGIVLVALGILMFLGKGFSFVTFKSRLPKDFAGIFVFGALFAVGWSACIGPVIAGIFTMAAVLHNYFYTALLLFFYALGLAIPLFFASFAYDRFNLSRSRLLQGFNLTLRIGKSEVLLTSTNMVSGLLMVFLGLFFIINRGTTAITGADLLGMIALLAVIFAAAALVHKFILGKIIKSPNMRKIAAVAEALAGLAAFAYITRHYAVRTTGLAERLSRAVLGNTKAFSIVAAAVFVVFAVALAYFIKKQLTMRGERK